MRSILLALALWFPSGPVVLPLAAPHAEADEARLAEARKLLWEAEEGSVRRGTQICVQLDSVESTELLIEVLRTTADRGLAAAHYRDVVWGGLLEIRDRYARLVVQRELKENKGSAWVRQWCAEILGLYGDGEYGAALNDALRDKDDAVRAAAARALGRARYPHAQKNLEKAAKAKDPVLRANAIEALALCGPEENHELYLKGLRDKDAGVRCALLGAGPEAYPEEVEALSTAALEDEDWRPRIQAVENLAGVRTKTAVDTLLVALDDGRPAVGARAIDSLQLLTHQKFTRPDQWRRWWEENRETFAFPEGRTDLVREEPGATVSVFNGIRLESDHVAFLLDKSQAMSERLNSRGVSKDEAAHQELERVLADLAGRLTFNVFCYSMDVRAFQDRAVELAKATSKKALAFHEKSPISGRKDIWAVLLAVLEDPQLDTAYLLSSGEPDVGTYVHWNRVTYQLKELNRFHKVVFHAIAYSDNQWYRDQLEKIADATGGEFTWFE
jgi:HEAT repeat protein